MLCVKSLNWLSERFTEMWVNAQKLNEEARDPSYR